jgi:putative membrane protein
MDSGYLWIKAFHIVFVASWFAGLFYLPRIFVNLAQETHAQTIERLLLMARKLYRFMTLLAAVALLLGLWMWLGYGVGRGAGSGWMHAKLLFVLLIIGYHHSCWILLRKFERGANTRSHKWFRVFNEAAVLMFIVVVILVVIKPSF